MVSLQYPDDTMPPEFEKLVGDRETESSAEIAQKANPIVAEVSLRALDSVTSKY